jgi:hypothetical protein
MDQVGFTKEATAALPAEEMNLGWDSVRDNQGMHVRFLAIMPIPLAQN